MTYEMAKMLIAIGYVIEFKGPDYAGWIVSGVNGNQKFLSPNLEYRAVKHGD